MKPEDAVIKARYYCAQQERCRFDVKRKLYDWKVDEQFVDKIISGLEKENFLSEQRFTALFVKSKMNQHRWGPVKINAELAKRGISSELINDELAKINPEAFRENMKVLAGKKLKELERKHAENISEKLKMYLYSKGYNPEMIIAFINKSK
jgi:regulatory protein